jgi:hypothetical protein
MDDQNRMAFAMYEDAITQFVKMVMKWTVLVMLCGLISGAGIAGIIIKFHLL